jgi:succinoglycan biosynthesis protein ExoL
VTIIGAMKKYNIQLFVHDLADAAVKRRVAMLNLAGADVSVVGFVRDPERLPTFTAMTVLGVTHNARFLHRIGVVAAQAFRLFFRRTTIDSCDVIIARNLEMLLLAHIVRLRSPYNVPVIYECLDVHRLMLGKGLLPSQLRNLERSLLGSSAGLITSSTAYVREYFHSIAKAFPQVILIENQVFGLPVITSPLPMRSGPPWTIAWNGAIRCAKSLDILRRAAALGNGRIQVVINGKVSYDQIPDFDAIVAASPWIEFRGAYRYPDDLEAIYSTAHFNWTIDMFWEGQNSTWALANRIYEGGRAGVVPIAQASVETGRYYKRLGIGLLLDDVSPQALCDCLTSLDMSTYQQLRNKCLRVDPEIWTLTPEGARKVLKQIRAVASL